MNELYVLLLLSFIRAITPSEESDLGGDEEKFGFFLRFLSTLVLLGLISGLTKIMGPEGIVFQVIFSLIVVVFGIPISIFLLRKFFKSEGEN